MKRRHVLLGATAVLAGLAGCSSGDSGAPTDSDRTSGTTTPEPETVTETTSPTTTKEGLTESGVRLTVTQIEELDLSRYSDDEIHKFRELNQEQQETFEKALEQNGIDLNQHNEFRMSGENAHRVIIYRDNYYRMEYSTV